MTGRIPEDGKPAPCVLLYVEDDDAAAGLFLTALEEAALNASLYRVSSGDEAAAFLSGTGVYASAPRPDLVLLDLNLPGKSGFDVLTEIRHNVQLRDLPVIVFSASDHSRDRERAREMGATDYIPKPGDYDTLLEIARRVCHAAC